MKKNKKIFGKKGLLIVLILLAVTIVGPIFAKYVIQEFHGYYLNSKHFYFTSNRLKKNNATYLVNNWSGVGSFDISFDLLSLKNSLVYTNDDVAYTVRYSCPNDVGCAFDKTSGTILRTNTDHSDTVTLYVTPTRSYAEGETLSIQIFADSVSPYVEHLRATFSYVVGKKGITYEIEDETGRAYMVFKITNAINYCTVVTAFGDYTPNMEIDSSIYRQLSDTDKAKCVCKEIGISFNPNTIILDTTSNIVNSASIGNTTVGGVSYVSSLDFFMDPLSTMAIKFYKNNTSNNYTYTGGTNQSSVINVNVVN